MFSHTLKIKRQYTRACNDAALTLEVIDMLSSPNRPSLIEISRQSKIPYNIIKFWNKNLKTNPNYLPGKSVGLHKRYFTDDEEKNISEMITMQYLDHSIMITRKHLRSILITAYSSIHPDFSTIDDFKKMFSYKFLKMFCKRNHLSFREMRRKKRSIVNQEEVAQYTEEMKKAYSDFPKSRIYNMDETPWNFVYKRYKVLAKTGKEDIDAQLPADLRQSFTALATISADGKKYPPVFLAKCKSYRTAVDHFKGMKSEDDKYEIFYSSGGYSDDATMEFYLKHLHEWANNEPCALVLDQYSSHVSDSTKRMANNLSIRLIYIPVSATDLFQPLDRRIFGIMKSKAASHFASLAFEHQKAFAQSEAADKYVKLWDEITKANILTAWKGEIDMTPEEDEEEDERDGEEDEEYKDKRYEEEEEEELFINGIPHKLVRILTK